MSTNKDLKFVPGPTRQAVPFWSQFSACLLIHLVRSDLVNANDLKIGKTGPN